MPLLTPYVASRSTDRGTLQSALDIGFTAKGPHLVYRDERPQDRDKHGNLWVRVEESDDPGHIQYDSLHPTRQRTCMEQLLCQICARPADRNKDGWLFIDWRRQDSPPTWPEKSLTTMPPLCTEHAHISARQCPFLRHGEHTLLRVRKPHPHGVAGTLYTLTTTGWTTTDNGQLSPYNQPRHPGMLASLLIRQLRGVKVVEHP
ncbi:hypothetical protein OHA98_05250 [Streptomyces sp. NBC_00654]|uniref:hypothetical protein n=1 Tax=Streptomyces sp. NBC_00654 TaxID=2975799 RepID=UPI0022520A19|nr:hypothetical protein [Streptomyces sp. NBC_00654]MCX4964230.1 hypothetical protein [Streptomyces sp. NBC_00654]